VYDLPRLIQQLRQCLRLADDGKEIGITCPARYHVLVQVGGDSGASDSTLIDPEVEALRRAGGPQYAHRVLGQCTKGGQLVFSELSKVRDMPVRADEKVSR
jgi:hypothetical protein